MTHPQFADSDGDDVALLERLRSAADLLEAVAADRGLLARVPSQDRHRLLNAAGQVYVPDTAARRQLVKATIRQRKAAKIRREEGVLGRTGIRTLRRQTVLTTPNFFRKPDVQLDDAQVALEPEGVERQHCYVCKQSYSTIHHFYDQLCPSCAELNYSKRSELANLHGRVALLTGGRVKIGYQAGLKLLRAGAELILTTRFPRDSAARYAREPDFGDWGHRLEIFGLDLRHTPSVEAFCRHLMQTRERLDFIVNNACQTVRRPPEFYEHMMAGEKAVLPASLEKSLKLRIGEIPEATRSAELSQVRLLPEEFLEQKGLFPAGSLDQDLQQ